MQISGLKYGSQVLGLVDFPHPDFLTGGATNGVIQDLLNKYGKIVAKPVFCSAVGKNISGASRLDPGTTVNLLLNLFLKLEEGEIDGVLRARASRLSCWRPSPSAFSGSPCF